MASEFFIVSKAADTRKTNTVAIKQTKGQLSPKYPFQDSINIVKENIYAKRCLDEIYKTTVGKGLETAPDDWKIILNQDLLERIDKDYLKTGNAFAEIKTLNGKIIAIYHVPVLTMVKMADGRYKQPSVKDGADYPSFATWTGQETGEKSFILHLMDYEDDENYGCPFWLAAQYKILQSTNSDIYNSNFFKNDCKPDGIILGTGLNLSADEKTALKQHLSSSYKGVANSRKTMVAMSDTPGSELKYVKFGDTVIDMSFINLLRENKTDICAAFRVPPKLVGLETPGRLGGGNDFAIQTNLFYENEIIPRQVYYEEIFSKMAGQPIQFKRPKLMEVTATQLEQSPVDEVQKNEKEAITDILKLIADKLS